jgi:hypothetical protein
LAKNGKKQRTIAFDNNRSAVPEKSSTSVFQDAEKPVYKRVKAKMMVDGSRQQY